MIRLSREQTTALVRLPRHSRSRPQPYKPNTVVAWLGFFLLALTTLIGWAHVAAGSERKAAEKPGSPRPEAPIRFDSEIVRLFVEGDSLEVEGIYYFACLPATARYMTLFYPYPVDSLLGGVRTVSGECRFLGEPRQPLSIQESGGPPGFLLRIPLSPGDTLEVRIIYRQELLASYARYIVTSTRAWKRPLRKARFEIYLPEAARSPQFSYPFKQQSLAGQSFYLYEVTDFWPDQDIVVRWVPH